MKKRISRTHVPFGEYGPARRLGGACDTQRDRFRLNLPAHSQKIAIKNRETCYGRYDK